MGARFIRVGGVVQGVGQREVRGRGVRIAVEVRPRGTVDGARRKGDHEVPGPDARGDASRGADPDQLLRTKPQELLGDDGERRCSHAGGLHAHRTPAVAARPTVQPAVLVDHARVLDAAVEALRDASSPDRIAGQEHQRRVVAGLGVQVDLRHRREHSAGGNPRRTASMPPCPPGSWSSPSPPIWRRRQARSSRPGTGVSNRSTARAAATS